MRTEDFTLAGRTLRLCLNAAALFDCYDHFGDDRPLLDHLQGEDRASFDALCWMLFKLSEQGELVRRWQGHTPEKILQAGFFQTALTPGDVPRAKEAVIRAVRRGFSMESEPERVDLGLAELQKKNGGGRMRRRDYLPPLIRMGLSVRESLLLTPGEAADLLRALGRKEL